MDVNPEMLVLARRSRGLTQAQLAKQIGVSQAKVCKYELGQLNVSNEDSKSLARVLDYPESFFAQPDKPLGLAAGYYYRKRTGLPVKARDAIEAEIDILRIRVNRLLQRVDLKSPNEFPWIDIDTCRGREVEVARKVRAAWNLPPGPIRNVTALIESAGGIVVSRPLGTKLVDAIIQAPNGMRPLFLVNSSVTAGDRLRYTLAHEIGHIVMRNWFSEDQEKEADQFASEFLLPALEIGPSLYNLTLDKALRLKAYWRVSMQAIIRRARDLGKITPRKYRSLFTEIGARQYRTNEPLPILPERPSLIFELVDTHRKHYGLSASEIRDMILISPKEYTIQFEPEEFAKRGFGIVG